jgi:hypothetical protein
MLINSSLIYFINMFYDFQAQMVRRVKAYLNQMTVITDEEHLHRLSLECEMATSAPSSVPVRKRHPSPTLSTTSSTSSTSEGKKGLGAPKFGKDHYLPTQIKENDKVKFKQRNF